MDPDGNSPLIDVAAILGVGVYALNAPIPGVGRVAALTIAGTDITLVGWNYFRMDPLARNIIDQHEAVHSQQNLFWAIQHPVQREIDAYQVMYESSQDLLKHWWERTRLPINGKAYKDVQSLFDSSETYLKAHGDCQK